MAPKMRFRFRKTMTIIPKTLFWTVSKKGTSIRLKIGPYSRSWGTRASSQTIDMPGTSGIFWRKQKIHKAYTNNDDDPMAEIANENSNEEAGWVWFAVVVAALIGLFRIYVHMPGSDCTTTGMPLLTWAAIVAVVGTIMIAAARRVPTAVDVLLAIMSVGGLWWLYNAFISGKIICG